MHADATSAMAFQVDWAPIGKNGKVRINVAGFTDQVDVTLEKERARFAAKVFKGRRKEKALLVAELERIGALRFSESAKAEAETDVGADPKRPPDRAALLAATPTEVLAEARELLRDPHLFKHILDHVARNGVAGERPLTAALYVSGTSRKLPKPVSVILQGPTASGKSHTIDRTAEFMPPEAVIRATQMTPQALFHMEPGSLVHRFVVAGERSRVQDDDTAEATRALREMLSGGKLSKLMPVREGSKIVTTLIEQEGPIAFVESTTLSNIFEEDANRCILLQTDEQERQTRRILDAQAGRYQGEAGGEVSGLLQLHHALQRLLEPLEVVIPFARAVADELPARHVGVRRAFPHVMQLVAALALLHQFQRKRDFDGRLLALPEDYQLAHHLLDRPMARLLGGALSPAAERFLDKLRSRFEQRAFSSTAARKDGDSKSAVSGWLQELHEAERLEQLEPSRGSQPALWRINPGAAAAAVSLLPDPMLLFPEGAKTHERQAETIAG